MSIAVMSAVWGLDLPKEQKLVLLAFADHADDDGFCWPSLARIAWKCGYTQRRAVSEIVKKLIDTQILSMVEPPHGRMPARYHIRTHFGTPLPAFDPMMFKGAKNAPQEDRAPTNALNAQSNSDAENSRGAENAPLSDRGAATAPLDGGDPVDSQSVGVHSSHVGVHSSTRRGAVASAPESYNHQKNLKTRASADDPQGDRARAQEGKKATPAEREYERRLAVATNEARRLGLIERTANETLDHFEQRVNAEAVRQRVRQFEAARSVNAEASA